MFHDNRAYSLYTACDTGPPILLEEVRAATVSLKERKAPGPDGMVGEFIKLSDGRKQKFRTVIFEQDANQGNPK